MRSLLNASVLLCLLCPATLPGADPVTLGTLLDEMIDMARLGNYPDPAYKTVQFSSYDRRSTVPGGPDWYANSDGFGGEPIPNFAAVLREPNEKGVGKYLICDVSGPGAVVRTWSARIEGTICVYLDDAENPLFDGPAQQFLQTGIRSSVTTGAVPEELYIRAFQQRDACYFPIPFAKRCRIEWTGNPKRIHFYEVQVRCYNDSARVVPFAAEQLAQHAAAVRGTAAVLANPQGNWNYRSHKGAVAVQIDLEPGQVAEAVELAGPMAVERLTLRVGAADVDLALRQTILRIACDDHADAQVQCPIGDFFGAAPGVNPFDSVPFTVEPDGTMTTRFVMPFARKCRIEFENLGEQPVQVQGTVLPLEWTWDDDRSMHFRARWRVDHDLVARGGPGAQDLPFLLARGAGVYVGTAIMLLNPSPIPTPYGSWWGEGDEKVFVDEDTHPSTFGTGSEDYFNYSWSAPDIFVHAYCGQPRNDGPGNRGFVVNQRWHIVDALPFRERIAFYMELFSHERTEQFSYARIGYHYGRPGMSDDFVGMTREDVRPLQLPEKWQPAARFGARNSVFHQAHALVSKSAQNTSVEEAALWADGQLLVWKPASAAETLDFVVPVDAPGRYAIHVTAAMTPHAPRVVATLNGKPMSLSTPDGVLDLKSDHRVLSRDFASPVLELEKGDHQLSFRVAADGEFAQGAGPVVGIDFIWIQKQ